MFSTFFHRYSRYSFARNERKNTSKKPSRYNFSIKSALLYFGKTTRSPLPEKPDKTGFSVRRTPKGSPEGTEHEVRCHYAGMDAGEGLPKGARRAPNTRFGVTTQAWMPEKDPQREPGGHRTRGSVSASRSNS